jgi:hypothetical protein
MSVHEEFRFKNLVGKDHLEDYDYNSSNGSQTVVHRTTGGMKNISGDSQNCKGEKRRKV